MAATSTTACGALYPEAVAAAVRESGAHVGIALDGDADRCVMVDDLGQIVDGDVLLALCAADLHSRDRLAGGGVVATVMSNLGLEKALESLGRPSRAHPGRRSLRGRKPCARGATTWAVSSRATSSSSTTIRVGRTDDRAPDPCRHAPDRASPLGADLRLRAVSPGPRKRGRGAEAPARRPPRHDDRRCAAWRASSQAGAVC